MFVTSPFNVKSVINIAEFVTMGIKQLRERSWMCSDRIIIAPDLFIKAILRQRVYNVKHGKSNMLVATVCCIAFTCKMSGGSRDLGTLGPWAVNICGTFVLYKFFTRCGASSGFHKRRACGHSPLGHLNRQKNALPWVQRKAYQCVR